MNGDAHFTEVFLDDARVPDADRIGAVGEGGGSRSRALSYERGAGRPSGGGGLLDVDRLVDARTRRGSAAKTRSSATRLAAVDHRARVHGLHRPARPATPPGPGRPGPGGIGDEAARERRRSGDYTTLAARHPRPRRGAGIDRDGEWQTLFLTAPSLSIRGGTDEIQRNIVGERVLGLPPEPRVDVDVPFSELPRTARRADR